MDSFNFLSKMINGIKRKSDACGEEDVSAPSPKKQMIESYMTARGKEDSPRVVYVPTPKRDDIESYTTIGGGEPSEEEKKRHNEIYEAKCRKMMAERKLKKTGEDKTALTKLFRFAAQDELMRHHYLIRVNADDNRYLFKIKVYEIYNLGDALNTARASVPERETFLLMAFSRIPTPEAVVSMILERDAGGYMFTSVNDKELFIDTFKMDYMVKPAGTYTAHKECVDMVMMIMDDKHSCAVFMNLTNKRVYTVNANYIKHDMPQCDKMNVSNLAKRALGTTIEELY
uniref:ORF127 n=1 Tax=Malaco herpesvirus 1 TaxID=3031797 RepID=A0AA48P7V4_9VIRU|nr:TPA_asm: ORF127 [Malaco herpesvirus 1]